MGFKTRCFGVIRLQKTYDDIHYLWFVMQHLLQLLIKEERKWTSTNSRCYRYWHNSHLDPLPVYCIFASGRVASLARLLPTCDIPLCCWRWHAMYQLLADHCRHTAVSRLWDAADDKLMSGIEHCQYAADSPPVGHMSLAGWVSTIIWLCFMKIEDNLMSKCKNLVCPRESNLPYVCYPTTWLCS